MNLGGECEEAIDRGHCHEMHHCYWRQEDEYEAEFRRQVRSGTADRVCPRIAKKLKENPKLARDAKLEDKLCAAVCGMSNATQGYKDQCERFHDDDWHDDGGVHVDGMSGRNLLMHRHMLESHDFDAWGSEEWIDRTECDVCASCISNSSQFREILGPIAGDAVKSERLCRDKFEEEDEDMGRCVSTIHYGPGGTGHKVVCWICIGFGYLIFYTSNYVAR